MRVGKIEKLVQPFKIGSLELKNRMVMAPMTTNYANTDGSVTDKMVAYYKVRANGGLSLVIVEGAYICLNGKGYTNQLGIDNDNLVVGLKKLVDTIHDQNCKALLQLYHASDETHSDLTKTPVAAHLIDDYVKAALRAKKAGFDGVEIHGAHGSLLNQYLSPYSNKRDDEYGGSLTNRMNLPLKVTEQIRTAVGPEFLVTYRFSAYEYVEGGLTLAETKVFAQELERVGVDGLSVSAGTHQFAMMAVPPMGIQQGCLANLSREIKKVVNTPVMVAGRINEPWVAEDILQAEKSDLIVLGRALLADAQFANRVMEGNLPAIRVCIACNQECIGRLSEDKDILCLINAQTGNEEKYVMAKTEQPKKILVAGGGAAGLEAARVAALRGHDVYLYERNAELGGKLASVAQPPRKEVVNRLKESLIHYVEIAGVKVQLNKEVTEEMVDQLKPDIVLLTTGSIPNLPPIPGIGQSNVCTADDILNKRVEAGKRVAVLGNGLVGAETADWLSELGREVTLVGKGAEVAPGAEALNKRLMMEALVEKKVRILNNAAIKEILPDGVKIEINEQVEEIHGMDTIVVALGYKANNQLLEILKAKELPVYVAGDCIRPRRIAEAIHEAFQAGLTV